MTKKSSPRFLGKFVVTPENVGDLMPQLTPEAIAECAGPRIISKTVLPENGIGDLMVQVAEAAEPDDESWLTRYRRAIKNAVIKKD